MRHHIAYFCLIIVGSMWRHHLVDGEQTSRSFVLGRLSHPVGMTPRIMKYQHCTIHCLPSGKRLHNYGKSQFVVDKSTINGHFQ